MTSSMNRAAVEVRLVSWSESDMNINRQVHYSGSLFCLVLLLFVGTLSSIPTALTRWTDECKVLDAESMHDCVAGKRSNQNFFPTFTQTVCVVPANFSLFLCVSGEGAHFAAPGESS